MSRTHFSYALPFAAIFLLTLPHTLLAQPAVNQDLGMLDVFLSSLTEADCRVCHDRGVPGRHHHLHNKEIPSGTVVPYPDTNGDGLPDKRYSCLSCHGDTFELERDCTVCHNAPSPHHQTPAADAGDCKACHGDFVSNMGDGHYVPTYSPSLVTPTRSDGDGLPLNARGNGAGGCNYCHDDDGLDPPVIADNATLHHGINLIDFENRCAWCHDFSLPLNEQIRVCEGCHSVETLHNIQADSNGDGNIVVGGELMGFGHVGADGGPGDSDCWGCHGFDTTASAAPFCGPIVPALAWVDTVSVTAGKESTLLINGAAFINTVGDTAYQSAVLLTGVDGTSVALEPEILLDEGNMAVTIPGGTEPGNYRLQVTKGDLASNPTVLSVTPEVIVKRAVVNRGLAVISGSGFAGFAEGSGTTVMGTYSTRIGRVRRTFTVPGTIVAWDDARIVVLFPENPRSITVNSVFGSDTYRILPE